MMQPRIGQRLIKKRDTNTLNKAKLSKKELDDYMIDYEEMIWNEWGFNWCRFLPITI